MGSASGAFHMHGLPGHSSFGRSIGESLLRPTGHHFMSVSGCASKNRDCVLRTTVSCAFLFRSLALPRDVFLCVLCMQCQTLRNHSRDFLCAWVLVCVRARAGGMVQRGVRQKDRERQTQRVHACKERRASVCVWACLHASMRTCMRLPP